MDIWSLPIFTLIGTACFVLIGVMKISWAREDYGTDAPRGTLYSRPSLPLPRLRRRGAGWTFIEQLAAIMGIISFIIQIAMWVYPWL